MRPDATNLLSTWTPRVLASLLALLPGSVRAGSGGPDPGGYLWFDQAEACPAEGAEWSLAEVESFGQNEWLIGPIDLGFHLPFYDRVYEQIWVHSDGLVFFSEDYVSYLLQNQPIPFDDGIEDGFVAPFWHWQRPDTPSFWWERSADAESFRLVAKGAESPAGPPVHWQLLLTRDGEIRIEWFATGSGDGNVTVGLEAPGQLIGSEVLFDGVSPGGFTLEGPGPHSLCFTRPHGLDCSGAVSVACGTNFGTLAGGGPGRVDDWARGGRFPGAEVVHEIELTEVSDLSAVLSPDSGLDQGLFLLAGCTPHALLDGGGTAVAATRLPAGTYRLVVDARTALDEGGYELDITCTPLGPTASCDAPFVGDSSGGPQLLDAYACQFGDFSGPEGQLLVDHAGGALTAALEPGDQRGVFLFDAAGPLAPRACLAGGLGGAALFDAEPGRYLVIVDSEPAAAGPFRLQLGCGPQVPCAFATTVECNSVLAGDTAGGSSEAELYGCTETVYSGPEAVFVFDNPVEQVVSFVLDDSAEPRLDLVLVEGCDEGACLGANDREISRVLPPGRYHLVIDGREGAAGAFELLAACGLELEPAFVSARRQPGQCLDERKTGWLTPAIPKADVLFLLDTSGSMNEEIAQLKLRVEEVIDRIEGFVQDGAYGLATTVDYISDEIGADPCWHSGPNYGRGEDYPWRLDQPITTDRAAVETAVAALTTYDGLDDAESYTRALYEAVADPAVAWRPDSRRIVVLFADEVPHDCNVLECMGLVSYFGYGIDFGRDGLANTADDLELLPTVEALADEGVSLVVLDSGGRFLRVASGDWPRSTDMWRCLAERTGGAVLPLSGAGFPVDGRDLADEVVRLIQDAGTWCDELLLVAEPGWEDWLAEPGPVHRDQRLPARAEWDISICVPPGTPPGTHAFEVRLQCDGLTVAVQQVVIEVGDEGCPGGLPRPDGVGAVLRGRHEGEAVTFTWDEARPLLDGEHFHLLKAGGDARGRLGSVNPEGDRSRSWSEVDRASKLQFFDLRVANACEDLSEDEFPQSR